MGRLGTSAFIHFTRKDLLSCSINKLNNFLTINGKDSDLQSFKKKINSSLSDHEKEFIKSKSTELKSKLISIEEQYLDLLQGFYELYLKEDDLSKASKYFLEHTYNPTKKEVVSFEKADEDKVMQKPRDSYKDASKTLQMKKSMAIYKEIMETMQVKHEDVSQLDLTMIIDELKKGKDDIREYSDVQIFRMIYNNNALLLKFDEIIKNRIKYDEIKASLAAPVEEFLPLLENKRSLPQSQHSSIFNITHGELSGGDLVVSESTNVLKTTPTKTFCSDTTLAGSNSDAQCPSRGFDGEDDRFLRANRDRIIEFRVKKNNGLSLLLDELEVSTRNNTRLARSNKNGRPYLRPGFYSGEKNFTHEFEDKGSNDRGLLNPHGGEKWHPSILLGGEVCPLEKKLGNNHDKKYTVEHRSVRRKSIETGPQLNISHDERRFRDSLAR